MTLVMCSKHVGTRVHIKHMINHRCGFQKRIQMTALTRVHAMVSRLGTDVPPAAFLNFFGVVMDQVLQHMDLESVAMLARSCKSLRVLTTDVELLSYVLQLVRQRNAFETRRTFMLSRSIPLCRTSRARYSQTYAFDVAMQAHGGLDEFRYAVSKRRKLITRRRDMAEARIQFHIRVRLRRIRMVTEALEVAGLPHMARINTPNTTETHMQTAMVMFLNTPFLSNGREEFHINRMLEQFCWEHFLKFHTDFDTRVQQRIDIVGTYPGIGRDIADEFQRPDVWPWMQ